LAFHFPRLLQPRDEAFGASRGFPSGGKPMSAINAFFSKWINFLNGNRFFVSFQVHSWFACTLVYHLGKLIPIVPLAFVCVALALWKEFIWDHKNEPNHNAWPEGACDFGSYFFGIALALAFHFTNT
jgi:hypothetical protein